MGLADEIASAQLPPSLIRTFQRGLRLVARANGTINPSEKFAIGELMGGRPVKDGPSEPLEALWCHAGLFVRACVYVALIDGDYCVEEARVVGLLAHRLGLSAHRLATLEAAVFRELKDTAERRAR